MSTTSLGEPEPQVTVSSLDQYISEETAEQLYELGFSWLCRAEYVRNRETRSVMLMLDVSLTPRRDDCDYRPAYELHHLLDAIHSQRKKNEFIQVLFSMGSVSTIGLENDSVFNLRQGPLIAELHSINWADNIGKLLIKALEKTRSINSDLMPADVSD
ncbi:hypothetical protein [Fibrella forsythiae]|uniref:YbjN domain-containing protein n=1 Tax=Fibrella forsythiae TaxID=2817061 RepID=A0ABS3JQF5_9BACT|nr:hypothetical protein [Fibrella forsythiae]MBO0951167.1 hypothetical protein [Fibrella forsythiae]